MQDHPEATHAVIHALNQWMYETWQFDYEGRIFATPVITLPIVEKAIEELEWVVERGAKAVLIRPAPVPGFQGSRSMALPEFDPFWEKVVEHDILVGAPLVRQRLRPLHQRLDRQQRRVPAVPAEPLPLVQHVAPDRGHGRVAGVPRRADAVPRSSRSPSSRTARRGWSRCCIKMAELWKKQPQAFAENPVETVKRSIHVSPFWEEDLGATGRAARRGPRPVRLRLPAPRGPREPREATSTSSGPPARGAPDEAHGRQPRPADGPPRRGLRLTIAGRAGRSPSIGSAATSAIVDGGQRLTYATQLRRGGPTFGAALVGCRRRARRPGRHLGAEQRRVDRSPSSGLWRAGAVLVPVNTRFKGTEAAEVLGRSGVRALVTVTDFLGTDYVDLLQRGGVDLPDLATTIVARGPLSGGHGHVGVTSSQRATPDARIEVAASGRGARPTQDPSDILFTSGTTGGRRAWSRPTAARSAWPPTGPP